MGDLFAALRRAACCVALAFIVTPAGAAEPIAPPSLDAYGSLPDIERMALSNDGSRLAAVMTIGGERVVIMMTSEIDTLNMMRLGDAKVRSLEWVGDDRVVVTLSKTEKLGPDFNVAQFEFWYATILSANPAQKERMVFENSATLLNAVFGNYGVRNLDGRWTAFFGGVERKKGARGYYIGDTSPALFAIDIEKNEPHRIAPPSGYNEGAAWLLGTDGQVAATMSMQLLAGGGGSWELRVPRGPVLATGDAPRGDVGLVALGKDGKSVIYRELDEKEKRTRWYEVPLDASKQPAPFAWEDEIYRTYTDRTTGVLIGVERASDHEQQFFATEQQAVASKIERTFRNFDVDMMDWTPDFSRVLVRTTGSTDSGTWYLVDMTQMRANAVGYERKAIEPDHVGPISTVAYKAQDGTDLDGILTLPPGREPKNLPVVMLPHGGPHSHDTAVFDWWAQAFASRGYAVFQPNFRGSTNRDEAFIRSGYGQWGKAMQTDISDGLAELIKQGIVDPKRACIMGASYGGYAALAGVTLQSGLYRCSVAVAPVSDLSLLFSGEYNDSGRSPMLRRSLVEELGPRDGFAEVSPRRFAAKADAPILLIHGKDDTVVPFEQSTKMIDALKDAGKPYEFVVMKEEDHWLSRAVTRKQMLEAAMAFVQKYNPAD